MTLRQSLLIASGVCLVIPAAGCGPQVDVGSPNEAGSASASDDETSGTRPTSGSGPDDTGPEQGVTTAPDPSDAGESTPEATDASSGSESSGGAPTLDCEPLCEVLIDGSCIGGQDGCLLSCEATVRDQGEAVGEAFAWCVATDYLCFSLLEDCMWAELYGSDPVEQHYTFEGEGFGAWDGRTVYAHVTAGAANSPTVSAVVLGGEVILETSLTTTLTGGNSRYVQLFVDLNDDGSCTPGIDHAQAVWMQSLGSAFDELSFVIPGTPTKRSSDGLCDQF